MAERTEFGSRQIVFPGSDSNVPLQIVRWTEQRAFITVGARSARVEIPKNAALIELPALESCFINFGDVIVEATSVIASDGSRLFLSGVQVIPVPIDPATDEPYTHVAAIQQSTAGILQLEQVA